MINSTCSAYSSHKVFEKAKELAYGFLNCSGRSTITGLITGVGQQFHDWSAYYRIFTKERIDVKAIFKTIFLKGVELSPPSNYVVAHMDDTIIRKTGKKIPGTSWRRDPLGPPFHTNFIWGQRYIELSLSIPSQLGIGPCSTIPIAFEHCPSAKKPNNKATLENLEEYKELKKQMNLNTYGSKCIAEIRQTMDDNNLKHKHLVMGVDGSYTNGSILKELPDNVSLIGRIRKDAKFNLPADQQPQTGRKRIYGDELPTPEEIRKSENYPWKSVKAYAAGKYHNFQIKQVNNVMWRKAGKEHKFILVVIRPLSYKLTKNSKALYRRPAYILCNNPDMDIQDILQFYLWRWQIEVNIGEEKSVLGVGQAQVRNLNATQNIPAFMTSIYSLLHLANIQYQNNQETEWLPRPKWYQKKANKRITTGDLINNFRAILYCKAIGISFSHFVNHQHQLRNDKNSSEAKIYSAFYARA